MKGWGDGLMMDGKIHRWRGDVWRDEVTGGGLMRWNGRRNPKYKLLCVPELSSVVGK